MSKFNQSYPKFVFPVTDGERQGKDYFPLIVHRLSVNVLTVSFFYYLLKNSCIEILKYSACQILVLLYDYQPDISTEHTTWYKTKCQIGTKSYGSLVESVILL